MLLYPYIKKEHMLLYPYISLSYIMFGERYIYIGTILVYLKSELILGVNCDLSMNLIRRIELIG